MSELFTLLYGESTVIDDSMSESIKTIIVIPLVYAETESTVADDSNPKRDYHH